MKNEDLFEQEYTGTCHYCKEAETVKLSDPHAFKKWVRINDFDICLKCYEEMTKQK
jgi:hypothetical protein